MLHAIGIAVVFQDCYWCLNLNRWAWNSWNEMLQTNSCLLLFIFCTNSSCHFVMMISCIVFSLCTTGVVRLHINNWLEVSFCLPHKIHRVGGKHIPPEALERSLKAIRWVTADIQLVEASCIQFCKLHPVVFCKIKIYNLLIFFIQCSSVWSHWIKGCIIPHLWQKL